MFKYHFKLMGICCFITNILLDCIGAPEVWRDSRLERYIQSLHFNFEIKDFIIIPEITAGIFDELKVYDYARRITFQFTPVILYHELDIYSYDAEERIMINITQRSPFSSGVLCGCFPELLDRSTKIEEPIPSLLIRDLVVYTK